jgi:hypothetical protein
MVKLSPEVDHGYALTIGVRAITVMVFRLSTVHVTALVLHLSGELVAVCGMAC